MKLVDHKFVGSNIYYYFENGIELDVKNWGNGDKLWFQNGKLHRLDGPACEYSNGVKEWWQNGKLHRLDGPAVEYSGGDKYWYQNGLPHRLDGPAIERANGDKVWFIEGKLYSKQDFNQKVKQFAALSRT